ncbi:uncharacterized protein LOC119991732 isoform X1 [Tripterygium wilfordii]|uniref:uncharacterized protein LOC119991732 isoform X1 n=1 Tax=Tripterygium wilfordii TaxID=458696 RepID=UPI0018F85EB6|nr:uncharacterized protein LOC119991732 isoform X1 [Tripterygium wilfordii]
MSSIDVRPGLQMPIRYLNPNLLISGARRSSLLLSVYQRATSFRLRAFSTGASEPAVKLPEKPPVCTADELHYVSVANSDWRLALWRYNPSPQAPPRNHPLLLLSGVGTNAIGYDLAPGSSFARYMAGQGYDTWVLEVRGAGLSVWGSSIKEIEQSVNIVSKHMEEAAESATENATNGAVSAKEQPTDSWSAEDSKTRIANNGVVSVKKQPTDSQSHVSENMMSVIKDDPTGIATVWDESKLVAKLTETFMRLSETLSGFLSEGQSKTISVKLLDQISKLIGDSQLSERFNEIREGLLRLLETRQNSAIGGQFRDLSERLVNVIEEGQRSVSPQLFDLQERFYSTIEDFQKQLDLIVKYDWDFDHYLEEDVPAAMKYIKAQSKPKDGKLLAIGHSMGGILLYAMLSRCGSEGSDPELAAIVTLASSLDYTSSKSTLKLLLPLADPAQALNVPVVPLGTLLAAAYPLSSRPPYVLSWLNQLISAEDMMHPEMLKKLVLNNFCTIPAKLLLQLTTAFRGDQDLICPPEAVEETAKLIPEDLVTYKVFGESGGPHYAHYDLVGGRLAAEQVYPYIIQFLNRCDT